MSKSFMLISIVYRSFLRHRFCVPGKDLNWFTDKEIENNVSEFCAKCTVMLITLAKLIIQTRRQATGNDILFRIVTEYGLYRLETSF